jgi:hypothetical protein
MKSAVACLSVCVVAALVLPALAVAAKLRGHDTPVSLAPARDPQCEQGGSSCERFDAIVFVHGIYGSRDTFTNKRTQFHWPAQFPESIDLPTGERVKVDVFVLEYQSEWLRWAQGANPSFESVAKAVYEAMAPLRKARYRSIGFIAHSLGGNVVSTYVHLVKTELAHPARAQNAFVITLATPVIGSQVADIGGALKMNLGIRDPLLKSLERGNLYLTMLQEFRAREDTKGLAYGCRPVHLHAAIEKKHLLGVLVVDSHSAAESISNFVSSPVVGFTIDHFAMAKPADANDPVYRWALDRIEDEYIRLRDWDQSHARSDAKFRLCERMEWIAVR